MLKVLGVSLICLAMAAPAVWAEETAAPATEEAGEAGAVKVKTRTQKLADACGEFDVSRPSCKQLRNACKKPVNSAKPECTALPVEETAATE